MRSNGPDDSRSFVNSARRAQIVDAAIETLAEVGYANASLARIAARLDISKGVISYHFAGKDDLIAEVVSQVLQQARAYMQPRIEAQTTGPEMLRTYIESNLEFIRDNPDQLRAIVEIVRATIAGAKSPFTGNPDGAAHILADLLTRFQAAGDFRADFDPKSMAMTIRAAIDVAPSRLTDPEFDIDKYAHETVTLFHLATRATAS
ncbi:MAG: TetR/AcrR family transcriptional regulator [Solirubrobacteraceae bacterium]|jgi:AcrR family transcriptional regulator